MLTATKQWGCECGCTENKIRAGDKFTIIAGTFYKAGHEPGAKAETKPKIILKLKRKVNE